MNWHLKLILGAAALVVGGGDMAFAPEGYRAVSPGVVLLLGVLLLLTGWADRQSERQRSREDQHRRQSEKPKPREGEEAKLQRPDEPM